MLVHFAKYIQDLRPCYALFWMLNLLGPLQHTFHHFGLSGTLATDFSGCLTYRNFFATQFSGFWTYLDRYLNR